MDKTIKTNLGKVTITLKNEYSNSKIYERLDVVSYKGSSYISKIDNNNSLPTDNSKWMKIAEKGVKGDTTFTTFDVVDGKLIAYYSTSDKDYDFQLNGNKLEVILGE